jgi:hypothetical protein
MMTTTETSKGPATTYHLEPSGTPGRWGVWYHSEDGRRGYNGDLHDCFTDEAAIKEQTRIAAVYGWNVAKIEVKLWGLCSDMSHIERWRNKEVAVARIVRQATCLPDFVDVFVEAINEEGVVTRCVVFHRGNATPEAVGAWFGIPARYVTEVERPRR